MNSDVVSIIVPIYNVSLYLERCILSIINQTYQSLDIILIDDGSTDNSGQICDNFATRDSRIKVWHQSNKGLSKTRNFGIERAFGKFLVFVDGDDYLTENHIENAIKHGLLHKEGLKRLLISFTLEATELRIVIDDNGIGRKRSMELNAIKNKKHYSYATQAIEKRVKLLNELAGIYPFCPTRIARKLKLWPNAKIYPKVLKLFEG